MTQPKRHVALCAFPFGTHAAPLLLLARRMSAIAPDIRFSFFNTERSNSTLFKAIDVGTFANIVPCNVTLPENQKIGPESPMKAIEHFLEFSQEAFRATMARVETDTELPVNCIISDAFLWYCCDIANEKNCSWIALWTAGTASLSAHVNTDVIRTIFGDPAQQGTEEGQENPLATITGLKNIRKSDLPMGIAIGDLNAPFSQMLHKMGLMMPKAQAVVLNVFEELSPTVVQDLNSKMRLLCVGPFPLTCPSQIDSDPYNCLEWLENHEPKKVAYISFGTVATPPPHEIKALAEALEVTNIPFLWSMNDSSKAHLPESFMDRIQNDDKLGKIVPWAPQMKLLGHPSVGVFVTHCGWNSIMESISTGVPLICRPMLGDQALNQRVIEHDLKFGIGIEGGCFTQKGTIYALHQILSSDEGMKMRENVEELKKLAEESVKPNGTSFVNFNALTKLITTP